jgi:hypothetical protein
VPAKGGRRHRAQPDRPRQAGRQAAPADRRQRRPARRPGRPGQPPRLHHVRGDARRRAADPAAGRAAPAPAGQAARRQGLRLPAVPGGLPPPAHPAPHRPGRGGAEGPARPPPLGYETGSKGSRATPGTNLARRRRGPVGGPSGEYALSAPGEGE